jgi:hypothetical protein
MAYTRPVKFSQTGMYGNDLPGEDDVYTVDEFKRYCEIGAFIDYDGHGYPVKDKLADESVTVKPSRLSEIPSDATHVVWFNR